MRARRVRLQSVNAWFLRDFPGIAPCGRWTPAAFGCGSGGGDASAAFGCGNGGGDAFGLGRTGGATFGCGLKLLAPALAFNVDDAITSCVEDELLEEGAKRELSSRICL